MLVNEAWLREWVNPAVDTDTLVKQLTMAGLEVDGVEPAAPEFSGVVVGVVESCEQHPDADKLRVCQVSNGTETTQVVCGASNVRPGLKIPFAQVGAKLPGDFKIKKAKLRGVESNGMLCGASELGLEDLIDGLMELPEDAPVGKCFRDGKDPPNYTYSNVQSWFRNRDVFNLHNIYLSINHENMHWLTMRIDMKQRKISLWDSQGVKEANRFYFVNALRFLGDEYVTRQPHNTDGVKSWMESWSFEDLSNECPQQDNDCDCGIFHLLNLCLLVEGHDISKNSYSQESVDAKEVRKVIAHILWKADPNRPTV